MSRRILILGGGFGGVKAALELSQDPRFSITLVSDEDYFRYYPALYHSATGGSHEVSAIPLSEIFAGHPVKVVKARAVRLNRAKQQVITKGAGTFDYDVLIVALGVVTNYFGIKGLQEHSFGIKSMEEVARLKKHLHEQLVTDGKPDLHYLVVGGGPTGVEVSGMLPGYLKQIMKYHGSKRQSARVELIEAAPRILPKMPKTVARVIARRLRRLGVSVHANQRVEAARPDALVINGKPVATKTVIWTAGIACNPFLPDNNFTLTPHYKAEVNEYLQTEPNIYVLGDNADTPFSGVAQTALYDGVFVADNLKRQADGKLPEPYKPKQPTCVVPVGPNWAAIIRGKITIYGRLGWFLHQLTDLSNYRKYQPWWPASRRWRAFNDKEESCPICANAQET